MKLTLLVIIPLLLVGIFILCAVIPETSNQLGGTTVIISFLTVLLTYIYVVLTGMMVQQMVKSHENENRPYILPNIEFDDEFGWIVIKNIGKKPAINLKIQIEPPLIGLNKRDIGDTIFGKPISFFPPGNIFRSVIDESSKLFKNNCPEKYNFILSYSWDGQKDQFVETYEINIEYNKACWLVNKKTIDDVVCSLEQIQEHLGKIQKSLNK